MMAAVFLLSVVLGLAIIWGLAWLLVTRTELGKDVLKYSCGLPRCPVCDLIILDGEGNDQGSLHRWCEDRDNRRKRD